MGTGIASGTGVPSITVRACSRHCQGDGDKTLPCTFPVEGAAGPLPGLSYTSVGLGESRERVGEREGSKGGSSWGIPLRESSREPGLPRPSQDSRRMELILGCQAYNLDRLGVTG